MNAARLFDVRFSVKGDRKNFTTGEGSLQFRNAQQRECICGAEAGCERGWEAGEIAARELNTTQLFSLLANRETAAAEDLMRAAVMRAQRAFEERYHPRR